MTSGSLGEWPGCHSKANKKWCSAMENLGDINYPQDEKLETYQRRLELKEHLS